VQILCCRSLSYFCPARRKWCDIASRSGSAIERMQNARQKHEMVISWPIYEREMRASNYNTAAVIDGRRQFPRQYARTTSAQPPGSEKFFFKRQPRLPVSRTRYATIGVYICYDRHFPEARDCSACTARKCLPSYGT